MSPPKEYANGIWVCLMYRKCSFPARIINIIRKGAFFMLPSKNSRMMKKAGTLDKNRKDSLRRQLKEYEATIGTLTEDERKELREWVATGNSVHDNPYSIYGEDGYPMDYINAIRYDKELCEEMRDLTSEQLAEFERGREDKDPTDPLTGEFI